MITFVILNRAVLPPKKVVITGGPGTGKTSIVNSLMSKGFICFEEIIRKLTSAAKEQGDQNEYRSNPLVFVKDPLDFNTRLLEGRMEQFHSANTQETSVVFYDRGIPDVLAYMNYFGQAYTTYFEQACKELRYDEVILLPPWKDIYKADEERLESFEEAVAIHSHLEETYHGLGYGPVMVPKGTVAERTSFIIEALKL